MRAHEILILASILCSGISIGLMISKGSPKLGVVSQNSGVCTGCGSATVVTIRERRGE